jgi:hypothetical protein
MSADLLSAPRSFGTDLSNLPPRSRAFKKLETLTPPSKQSLTKRSPVTTRTSVSVHGTPSRAVNSFQKPQSPRNLNSNWRIKEASSPFKLSAILGNDTKPFDSPIKPPSRSEKPESTPKIEKKGSSENGKYSREFLLSFKDKCVEMPEDLVLRDIIRPYQPTNQSIAAPLQPFEDLLQGEELLISNEHEFEEDQDFPVIFTPDRIIPLDIDTSSPHLSAKPRETDSTRLSSRQKQLDIGKNTPGYRNYIEMVPKEAREKGHPRTPNKNQVCSKRSWDGQVRKWRRMLHFYDPPAVQVEDAMKADEYPSAYESMNAPCFYLALSEAS